MAFNGRILLDITKLVTLSTTEITYYFHALKINVLCHATTEFSSTLQRTS